MKWKTEQMSVGDSLPDIHRGRRRFLNGPWPVRGASQTVPCLCVVNLITCIHHEALAPSALESRACCRCRARRSIPEPSSAACRGGASRATRRLADFTLCRSLVSNPPQLSSCYEDKRWRMSCSGGRLNALMDCTLRRPAPDRNIWADMSLRQYFSLIWKQ